MVEILSALLLIIPLIVGGSLHMAAVKLDIMRVLRVPIDTKLFGPNKTWRGVVLMVAFTIVGVLIAQALEPLFGGGLLVSLRQESALVLGSLLGLAYAAAELPNSYLKRRLGVAPGELPKRGRILFLITDQADSALGCVLAYAATLSVPARVLAILLLFGPVVHLAANSGLYLLGLRKRPV
ncbi:MAG: CDP-archaeol synthase [Deltaproteobacteria bacterium]|nr:CDP-archaeol synthase [Deltaproteobacteria bacterium]